MNGNVWYVERLGMEKKKRSNPMYCPFCKDRENGTVIPIDVILNLAICVKCKELWQDGILVKIVPKNFNPSRRNKWTTK